MARKKYLTDESSSAKALSSLSLQTLLMIRRMSDDYEKAKAEEREAAKYGDAAPIDHGAFVERVAKLADVAIVLDKAQAANRKAFLEYLRFIKNERVGLEDLRRVDADEVDVDDVTLSILRKSKEAENQEAQA